MKKIILLVTTNAALFITCFAQPNTQDPGNNNAYEMNQYLLKAKRQKTAAWVCFSGGSVLLLTGFVIGTGKAINETYGSLFGIEEAQQDYTGESFLMLLGGTGIVISIPFFIASGNNKQKARLMFTNQKTIGLVHGASKKIPGLTVSFSL